MGPEYRQLPTAPSATPDSLKRSYERVRRRSTTERTWRRRRRGLRVVPPRRPGRVRRARTAATAARAATSGWSPTATWPRCSPFATTRTAGPATACTARARTSTASAATSMEVAVPEGTVASDLYTGELLADLAAPRRPLAGRRRRSRRARQRQVPVEQAPRADFAEQGEHGEERWLQARAEADGRRRARRLPQRRQEHADQRDLRRQAEDRRLPVHHARAAPRRRARSTSTPSSSSPTSPA